MKEVSIKASIEVSIESTLVLKRARRRSLRDAGVSFEVLMLRVMVD